MFKHFQNSAAFPNCAQEGSSLSLKLLPGRKHSWNDAHRRSSPRLIHQCTAD